MSRRLIGHTTHFADGFVMTHTERSVRLGVRFARLRWLVVLGIVLLIAPIAMAADDEIGVRVPEGFQVTRYADDALAHDIYSMTVDSLGRVVVSGPGYIKILIDTDGDGKADTAKQFADGPASGAQGMCFVGRDLLCVGDEGLIRYRDANGDDRADGPPETFLKIPTGGEHNAHAIRRGPDGWWYLIAGNSAEVDEKFANLPTSPVKHPYAGTIILVVGRDILPAMLPHIAAQFGCTAGKIRCASSPLRDHVAVFHPARVTKVIRRVHVQDDVAVADAAFVIDVFEKTLACQKRKSPPRTHAPVNDHVEKDFFVVLENFGVPMYAKAVGMAAEIPADRQ